jgi:hypothetical protein
MNKPYRLIIVAAMLILLAAVAAFPKSGRHSQEHKACKEECAARYHSHMADCDTRRGRDRKRCKKDAKEDRKACKRRC